MKTVLTAALLALLAVLPASAQVAGGSITGTVTDEQKAVLPGVTVTIQGSDRTQTAITDDTGKFRFLNQPPGTYTVTVELASADAQRAWHPGGPRQHWRQRNRTAVELRLQGDPPAGCKLDHGRH